MAHHQFQGGCSGHCQLFVSDFRPLIDLDTNETDSGALTGRISCGPWEIGARPYPDFRNDVAETRQGRRI